MASPDLTINQLLKSAIPQEPSGSSPCAACTVRDLTICSVLEGDELDRLNSIMTEVSLSKGEYIIREGDEPTLVYNINAGVMQLSKSLPDG